MDLEQKVEKIIARYQLRFNRLLEEIQDDLRELVNLEGVAVEEIPLGEVRKAAILTKCLEFKDLKRQTLSGIAQQFGRKPGSVAVFFRPDVGLMKTTGNNARNVTEKGKQLVQDFKEKFGDNWIVLVNNQLKDDSLPDSATIKLKKKVIS